MEAVIVNNNDYRLDFYCLFPKRYNVIVYI